MAAQVNRVILLLAITVSLIQAQRRRVQVVTGTVKKESSQPHGAYSDPWGTDWGSSPEASHTSNQWASNDDNYWNSEPEPHWGAETNNYWQAAPQHSWGAETNNPWGADTNNPFGAEPNNPFGAEPQNPWGADPNNPWGAETNNHRRTETNNQWGNGQNNIWGAEPNPPVEGAAANHWGANDNHWAAATNDPWAANDNSHWESATSNQWPGDDKSSWDSGTNLWAHHTSSQWGGDNDPWGTSSEFPNYPDNFFGEYPTYSENSFGNYPDYGGNQQNQFDYYDYYSDYGNYPDYGDYPSYSETSRETIDYTKDYPGHPETPGYKQDYPSRPETPQESPDYTHDYPDYPDAPQETPDYTHDYPDYPDTPQETPGYKPDYPSHPETPQESPDYTHDYPDYPDAPQETPDYTHDYPDYPDTPQETSGYKQDYPSHPETPQESPDYTLDYPDHPEAPQESPDYTQDYPDYPDIPQETPDDTLDYPDHPDAPQETPDYPDYPDETPEESPDYTHDYPSDPEPPQETTDNKLHYVDYRDVLYDYLLNKHDNHEPAPTFDEYSDYLDYDYPGHGRPFGDYPDYPIPGVATTALEELFTGGRRLDSRRIPNVMRKLASGAPLSSEDDPPAVDSVKDFKPIIDTFNVDNDFGLGNAGDGAMKMPEMPTEGGHGGFGEGEMTDMMMKHLGFDVTNPKEVSEGELFQMDILLTEPQMDEVMDAMKANDLTAKKGISDSRYLWPPGPDGYPLVKYTFGDDKVKRDICKQAMDEWETHSCIKFEEIEGSSKEPHLRFEQKEGCYSYVGRIWFFEGQVVSIGKYCDMFSAVHEVGHALGLFHEQSRTDRDDFIHVNTDNIKTSRRHNFEKAKFYFVSNHSVQYDYTSIMHYKGKTYYNGGHSLSTKNPLYQELLASMDRLSFRDKLLINRMYSCIDKWLKICQLPSDPCQNGGYTGADCRCVCPPGTIGSLCQTETGKYYEMYMSGCSETITRETVVESQNYPQNVPAGVRCTKLIVPPKCHSVELIFYKFWMYPRIQCQNQGKCCYWDGLEIRTKDPYMGDWYCGSEIKPGQIFTYDGNMTLYYHAVSSYSQGFRAKLRFPPIEGCNIEGRMGSRRRKPGSSVTHLKKMTIVRNNLVVSNSFPSKPSKRVCRIQNSFGNLHWYSPAFRRGNYPTDFSCGFTIVPKIPAPLSVRFDFFELQPKFKKSCMDSVAITEAFGIRRRFCGKKTPPFVLPSSSLKATFSSDRKYTYRGFNITLEQKRSPCHKIIRTGMRMGRIKTPRYPRYHGDDRNCEWWIIAPKNKRVKISITGKRIENCRQNYLLVDWKGSRAYKRECSERICGKKNLPFTFVSKRNEIDILYRSKVNSKGFEIVYVVV